MSGVLGGLIAAFPTPVTGAFESIATASLSGVNTATFSSIPATYKHLQIRYHGLSANGENPYLELNGDTGSNYRYHGVYGSAGAVAAGGSLNTFYNIDLGNYGGSSTHPEVIIIDFIDYASTTKYKTLRSFFGNDRNSASQNDVGLSSCLWLDTTAINSIRVYTSGATNWSTGATVALYGIKGA
jgi:hypothetical protein